MQCQDNMLYNDQVRAKYNLSYRMASMFLCVKVFNNEQQLHVCQVYRQSGNMDSERHREKRSKVNPNKHSNICPWSCTPLPLHLSSPAPPPPSLFHHLSGFLQTARCNEGASNNIPLPTYPSPSITTHTVKSKCVFVSWMLTNSAVGQCISGTDLPQRLYVLPYWDTSCRSNLQSHPVTAC